MANIKSQIKRNRQNEKQRARNRIVRSRLRTNARRFREAMETGDRSAAEEAFQVISRDLDKAVSKGVMHRNTAANRKSAMAKRLNAL
jgi:small subunit ribosomal protein S20